MEPSEILSEVNRVADGHDWTADRTIRVLCQAISEAGCGDEVLDFLSMLNEDDEEDGDEECDF